MRKSLADEQRELNEAVREVGRLVWEAWRPMLEWIDRRVDDVLVGLRILADRSRFRT